MTTYNLNFILISAESGICFHPIQLHSLVIKVDEEFSHPVTRSGSIGKVLKDKVKVIDFGFSHIPRSMLRNKSVEKILVDPFCTVRPDVIPSGRLLIKVYKSFEGEFTALR